MLVGCEGSRFFFQNKIGSIHAHFEVVFTGGAEGDEGDEAPKEAAGGVFGQFGILPLVLQVCAISFTDFESVMSWPICQTMYVASYIITKNRYEDNLIKQMQMKNRL